MDQELKVAIPKPDNEQFKSAERALKIAQGYKIDCVEMRDMAAQDLTKVKAFAKKLDTQRKTITQPLDAAKAAVMDLFRAPLQYLQDAEDALKFSILKFDREEERKRLAEQAKLEEAARQERARLAAEAAQREAAARAEAERIQAEARAAAEAGKQEEAARLQAEAESRVEQGAAEVETLQQTAQLVTAPVAEQTIKKTKGVSTRSVWKVEVTDKLALIRWVSANPDYINLIEPNMPAIRQMGLALKEACPIIGVRVFEDEVISARSA